MKKLILATIMVLTFTTNVYAITNYCDLSVDVSSYSSKWTEYTYEKKHTGDATVILEAQNKVSKICNTKKDMYAQNGVKCECENLISIPDGYIDTSIELNCSKTTRLLKPEVVKKAQCDQLSLCVAELPGKTDDIEEYKLALAELEYISSSICD